MKTILHIGPPKTGTTTLQIAFKKAHTEMLGNGVLYPLNPRGKGAASHKILTSMVLPKESYGRDIKTIGKGDPETLTGIQNEFIQMLEDSIKENRPKYLMLSAEHFSNTDINLQKLSEILDKVGAENVVCCAYYRQPSKHFLSRAQQKLKGSYQLPLLTAKHLQIFEKYADHFGRENFILRPFEAGQLVDGDIIADFCSTMMPDVPIEPLQAVSQDKNESMSGEAMLILQNYRRTFFEDTDDKRNKKTNQLLEFLAQADVLVGAQRPKLNKEFSDTIDYGTNDPLTVKEEFGVAFEGFDYDPAKFDTKISGRTSDLALKDMLDVDESVYQKIVDSLKVSQWILSDEKLEKWATSLAEKQTDIQPAETTKPFFKRLFGSS